MTLFWHGSRLLLGCVGPDCGIVYSVPRGGRYRWWFYFGEREQHDTELSYAGAKLALEKHARRELLAAGILEPR